MLGRPPHPCGACRLASEGEFRAGPRDGEGGTCGSGLRVGLADAFSVKLPPFPESAILQLEKVAMPLVGVTAAVQPPRVPPVPDAMVRVI